MASAINWQTGLPEQSGLYLVTMATGEVTVKEFYNSYTSPCSWWEDVEDYEEVVAWCDFKDVKPYKEATDENN